MLDEGRSHRQIAEALGIAKSTVAYHARNLDVQPDPRFSVRYDWIAIREAYEGGLSRLECLERFGFSPDAWYKAVMRGDITPRPARVPLEDLLVADRPQTSRTNLKARLIDEGVKENRCEICGVTDWLGKPLSMQLHHNNGNGTDNRLENISLLCANCHSQTDTYGGRNGHRRPKPALKLAA
jgi:hypothetical protein